MLSKPGLYPVDVEPVVLTMREVKELNRESIRLGFSRNLKNLGRLPDDMRASAPQIYRHVSRDNPPLMNIRLVLLLPTYIGKKWWTKKELKKSARSLTMVLLDITEDAWQVIRNRVAAQDGS